MTDFPAVAAPHCDCIYLCTRTLRSPDFRQIDLIRTDTQVSYPIGSAFTPVPQLFVRAPRFFFGFFPSRLSSSPTVQVRFVCGTSPSPDVVEKRCGCRLSCGALLSLCSVAAFCDRRVYKVADEQWYRASKTGRLTYPLCREVFVPRLELCQSCVSLPATTRSKLHVDPPPVKFRLMQTEPGL